MDRSAAGGPLRALASSATAAHVLCLLIVISFFGSVAIAASLFPTGFDMRYRWVSSLASSRDNPGGHHYFGAGLILVGLLSIPVVRYLFLTLPRHRSLNRLGLALLYIGAVALVTLGIEAAFFPNPGKVRFVHEVATGAGFGGYAFGFACFTAIAIRQAPGSRYAQMYGGLTAVLIGLPLIATGICELVWLATHSPDLFGSDFPEKKLPWLVFSKALWEWMLIIDLILVLWMTVWHVSRNSRPVGEPARGLGDLVGVPVRGDAPASLVAREANIDQGA
ncbi:MAG: hypothetical protein L6R19_00455 [Alphaproteobacteria bacterium]|nr:hypothetical protein [Alphaproteobacteria bacterium]